MDIDPLQLVANSFGEFVSNSSVLFNRVVVLYITY